MFSETDTSSAPACLERQIDQHVIGPVARQAANIYLR